MNAEYGNSVTLTMTKEEANLLCHLLGNVEFSAIRTAAEQCDQPYQPMRDASTNAWHALEELLR